jgi:hypothetical protein
MISNLNKLLFLLLCFTLAVGKSDYRVVSTFRNSTSVVLTLNYTGS